MPKRVVDELEMVEVDGEDRPADPVTEEAFERGLEAATIEQAGERIVVGEVAQLALDVLALGPIRIRWRTSPAR
jgi:hypothetical protein